MERRTERKKAVTIIAVIMIFFVLAFGIRMILAPSSAGKTEKFGKSVVRSGVQELELLANRDITDIKEKVKVAERMERLAHIQAGNFNVIYDDSVILGDSQAEGFSVYGFLNSARVAAVKGKNLKTCEDHVQQAINLNPSKVFMTYGMNDMIIYQSNVSGFIEQYTKVANQIKAALPDVQIYISSVIPAGSQAIAKKPGLAYSAEYNAALQTMCQQNGFTFINVNPVFNASYYEPDYIHTNKEFHRIWLNCMASESGLLNVWE